MSQSSPSQILDLFDDIISEVASSLSSLDNWAASEAEGRPDQYVHDVIADEIVRRRLLVAGYSVLSEESGISGTGDITVVVDPIDGSTNASYGLPWYATSLCAVDADGPWVSQVVNLAAGHRYRAVRGEGVESDSVPVRPNTTEHLGDALVGLSGLPASHGGWAQYRTYGAIALDLCAVATGALDGYVDVDNAHGVWDYLGALLVCSEAGVPIVDGAGRDLVALDVAARRAPIAGCTPALLEQLVEMYQRWNQ